RASRFRTSERPDFGRPRTPLPLRLKFTSLPRGRSRVIEKAATYPPLLALAGSFFREAEDGPRRGSDRRQQLHRIALPGRSRLSGAGPIDRISRRRRQPLIRAVLWGAPASRAVEKPLAHVRRCEPASQWSRLLPGLSTREHRRGKGGGRRPCQRSPLWEDR